MDQSSRGVPDGTEGDQSDQPATAGTATGTQTTTATNTPPVSATTPSSQQPSSAANWEPNGLYMVNLTAMGFSTVMAKKALFYTNNESAEAAIEWIFSNGDSETAELPLEMELQQQSSSRTRTNQQQQTASASGSSDSDLYKMVFIVNGELSMGVGKIAAQVAHAALGLHRILLQHQTKYGEPLLNWAEYGETKIVLRGETTNHLVDLEYHALKLDLPCYMVHDAGKTQVKSGSTTVLAIFGSNNLVDKVTRQLKLY